MQRRAHPDFNASQGMLSEAKCEVLWHSRLFVGNDNTTSLRYLQKSRIPGRIGRGLWSCCGGYCSGCGRFGGGRFCGGAYGRGLCGVPFDPAPAGAVGGGAFARASDSASTVPTNPAAGSHRYPELAANLGTNPYKQRTTGFPGRRSAETARQQSKPEDSVGTSCPKFNGKE